MKILHPNLSSKEITKAVDEILKGYYLSPRYVPVALRQVMGRHGFDEMGGRSVKKFIRYIANR